MPFVTHVLDTSNSTLATGGSACLERMKELNSASGSAAGSCGKALPFRRSTFTQNLLPTEAEPRLAGDEDSKLNLLFGKPQAFRMMGRQSRSSLPSIFSKFSQAP